MTLKQWLDEIVPAKESNNSEDYWTVYWTEYLDNNISEYERPCDESRAN